MSLVSFVRARAPDHTSIKNAIAKSTDLIQFNFRRDVKRILIKPNLCYYYDWSTGETTNPKFVGALIDVLRERIASNLNISVIESDASAMRCEYVFRMLGYEEMAEEKDVELVNLSEEENENVEANIGDYYFQFRLPHIFHKSDMLINVPKMKYQSGVQTDLVVVDGAIVRGVTTKRLGLVMSSTDPVAIDTAAAEILGLKPSSVEHITLASKEGVGRMQYTSKGENPTHIRRIFPRRRLKNKLKMLLAQVYMRYIR